MAAGSQDRLENVLDYSIVPGTEHFEKKISNFLDLKIFFIFPKMFFFRKSQFVVKLVLIGQ